MTVARRALTMLAALAVAALALCGTALAADDAPLPTSPLLPAPDPAAGTQRGTWLSDPQGQVENLAAIDHLVAWTVRTPADALRTTNADIQKPRPLVWPTSSVLYVVDERGGAPLQIDLGAVQVFRVRMLHGPGPDFAPQVAVSGCRAEARNDCTDQLFTLSPSAPLTASAPDTGAAAYLALSGRTDAGRRLLIGKKARRPGGKRECVPRLSLAELDGSAARRLPGLPVHRTIYIYPRCDGLSRLLLDGRYALAWVSAHDPSFDLNGTAVFGLDVDGGPRARWHLLQVPDRTMTGPGSAWEIGPAVRPGELLWEDFDTEAGDWITDSLEDVRLPRDLRDKPVKPYPPTHSVPIVATGSTKVCAIAATTDALYELTNSRCWEYSDFGKAGDSKISRLVAPVFSTTWPKLPPTG